MCKLNNIKDKDFIVYRIPYENYVGVTTDIRKRILKHKSRSKFNCDDTYIIKTFSNLKDALDFELKMQDHYNCKKGVRNQTGGKNPTARICLHKTTGVYYDTIKEACYALGINYSLMRHIIKNSNNKFNLIRV